jgi:hypothetical protein
MTRGLAKQLSLLALAGILVSCSAGTRSTSTLGTLETPTTGATTNPVLTSTPSAQPGNTPTSVPSPTPDVPLYDDGAWLLFQGRIPNNGERNSYLRAVNWDGTGLTDLLPDFSVWQYEIQPSVDGSPGRYVAAITSYGWSDKFMFTLAHLPDGEVVANIPLTNPQTELIDRPSGDTPDYTDYERRLTSSLSISDTESLAWSPDGTQIAFSGAQNGTQTDVYRYSLTDDSVSRLTWGQQPHHASNLLWSPDGQYIAYDDVSSALGTYPRYWVDGIWVVRADGSGTWQIASKDEWPPDSEHGNRPQKQGWISDHTIAVYAFQVDSLRALKQIDVETGRSSAIFDGIYCGAALAPEQDVWYITDGGASFLIKDGVNKNKVAPLACSWPTWSPDLNAFITMQGLVSTDGEQVALDLPSSLPLISPDGAYWAYPRVYVNPLNPQIQLSVKTNDVLWIGETGKQPRQFSDVLLGALQWSPNSRSVLITNNEEDLQYIAIAPDFELHLISQYSTVQYLAPWFYGEAIDD